MPVLSTGSNPVRTTSRSPMERKQTLRDTRDRVQARQSERSAYRASLKPQEYAKTPETVDAFNKARSGAVEAGNDPYKGNLRSYDRFARTYVPTVLSDTNIREKVIPRLQQDAAHTLTTYDQQKNMVAQESQLKEDKQFQKDQEKSKNNPMGDIFADKGETPVDPYTQKQLDLIDQTLKSSDAATRRQAERQKQIFDRQRQQQQDVANAEQGSLGMAAQRLGSRYTPGAQGGLMAQAQRANLEKLAQIDEDELSAVEELRAAQENKDFQAVDKKLGLLKDIRDERMAALEATRKAEADARKEVTDIVKSAAEGGAPREILASISAAADAGEAIETAGEYLQKASGTPGEYLYYKRDAIANGQVPLTYNEYADMDANRKRSITNISTGSAGLTPAQIGIATKLSDDYEQRSTDFYKLRSGYNQVVSAAKDPSGAGDISLLYGYMKMLDPNSVVRETEFATAQNAGSIPENIRAKYNAAVSGKKLSDAQRKDFINQANKTYTSAKEQQDQVKSEFENRSMQYGVPSDLVVRSTDATGSTGNNIIQGEEGAHNVVVDFVATNPQLEQQVRSLAGVVQPDLGRAYTWQEIAQIIGAQ